jgi:hypothetical protein
MNALWNWIVFLAVPILVAVIARFMRKKQDDIDVVLDLARPCPDGHTIAAANSSVPPGAVDSP